MYFKVECVEARGDMYLAFVSEPVEFQNAGGPEGNRGVAFSWDKFGW